jgi:hypothetical protein
VRGQDTREGGKLLPPSRVWYLEFDILAAAEIEDRVDSKTVQGVKQAGCDDRLDWECALEAEGGGESYS